MDLATILTILLYQLTNATLMLLRLHFSLLFLLLFFGKITAQNKDSIPHIKGELLIQTQDSQSVITLLSKFGTLNAVGANIRADECISPLLNIWIMTFNPAMIDEYDFLEVAKKDPLIKKAQFNHYIQLRNTNNNNDPNDPYALQQWYVKSTKANEAWALARGGTTPNGDTIVVAVIDNGTVQTHKDLAQNIFVNRQEIPDNKIDDDRNGYIDDYDGWNAVEKNDNISGGSHGVQVEGVIGAVGNNALGIAGMNWNVKMMTLVTGGSESSIVASYNYALKMRKIYNETKGKRGAFIVASNSSFGTANLSAADAPIWCSFYDSLGINGILNFAATANSETNVDEVNDMPSVCQSEYLVVVTASDQEDEKVKVAAFGTKNVDLAAPGKDIMTTDHFGNYLSTSGTSLATPIVSGVAALMYSVPCSDFANLSKTNPQEATLKVKNWILETVDKKTSLQNLTKTGGRLNTYEATLKVLQSCGTCTQPLNISFQDITTNTMSIKWIKPTEANSIVIKYRPQGTTEWQMVANPTSPLLLSNLQKCTLYEMAINSQCGAKESTSATFFIKTDGCCKSVSEITIDQITDKSLRIKWQKLTAANRYKIQLKETETGATAAEMWVSDTTFIVEGLNNCEEYDLQILSDCGTALVPLDSALKVKTLGCGICAEGLYCFPKVNNYKSEWIDSLSIGIFKAKTGKALGYLDTATNWAFEQNKAYPISITPAFAGTSYFEYFRVWIDYNQDGDFVDDGEMIFDGGKSKSSVSGMVNIPVTAKIGKTKMRVSMKFVGSNGTAQTPCEQLGGGEVEDYCINIIQGNISTAIEETNDEFEGAFGEQDKTNSVKVFPNPIGEQQFFIKLEKMSDGSDNDILDINLIGIDGKYYPLKEPQETENRIFAIELTTSLPVGVYALVIDTKKGVVTKKIMKK